MTAYPTLEQVETADAIQLLRWLRFLPNPGDNGLDLVEEQAFNTLLYSQNAILTRIKDRLDGLGGITPEISKAVGWGEQ